MEGQPLDIDMFRYYVDAVRTHKDCPEKPGIVREVRLDIEARARNGEISEEVRDELLRLLAA